MAGGDAPEQLLAHKGVLMLSRPPAPAPPARRPPQRGPRRRVSARSLSARGWLWRVGRGLLAVALVIVLVVAWPVYQALSAPGNDSVAARLAEVARTYGLGFLITSVENVQYSLDPPKVGGAPDPSQLGELRGIGPGQPPGVKAVVGPHAIATLVSPALAGEGQFHTVVSAHGRPAIEVAFLRPDSQHTSYLAGVAWMSGQALRFVQHPGAADPGMLSRWTQPPSVPVSRRAGLAATFNGGFKVADSGGGYYADRHTVGKLTAGAASLVVYSDGHVDIGSWGPELRMAPNVASVRQNLGLLIDNGVLAANLNSRVKSAWGATVGGGLYVWRSGVGVTANGDVVYVAGDALSAPTLGRLLLRAGAVRAMQLDINRDWVSYMWYSATSSSSTASTPHKLVAFKRPATRYFSTNGRDFFAVYTR